MVVNRRSGKLLQNMVGPLFIGSKIGLEIIGKKKHLEDSKHDNELDEDNLPQGTTHGHILKSVAVKRINTDEWMQHYCPSALS
jgi:hypothetical protein